MEIPLLDLYRAARTPLWREPRLLVGLFISGLLTWLALRGTHFAEVAQALGSMDLVVLFPALGLTFVVVWLRALRWRLLLLVLGKVSREETFRASVIGYMVNYLLPIRVGELVRAYLVASDEGLSTHATFATVVVERVIDIFTVLLILAVVSLSTDLVRTNPHFASVLRASGLGLLVVGSLVVSLLWAVRRHRYWLNRVLRGPGARWLLAFGRHAWRLDAFADGLTLISRPGLVFWFLIQTAAIWIASVGQIEVLLAGFHLTLPWAAGWLMLVSLAIGVALPAAPGLVGTFHYAAIVVLVVYGVERADAISYAIVLHAVSVVPILALGLFFVWLRGLSFRKLTGSTPRDSVPPGPQTIE